MGSKTIKVCDYCEKEIDQQANCIHLSGSCNFGSWKNLEFCNILCFMSYMDGNIRAYKEALEKEYESPEEPSGRGRDEQLLEMIRMVSGTKKKLKPFVKEEIALYDKYTKKFSYDPFSESEEVPNGVRKLELDD